MIAPRPGLCIGEPQARRKRIDDGERLEQALGVLMNLQDVAAAAVGDQAVQGLAIAGVRGMAWVCSRSSSTVNTTRRFTSSSSTSTAASGRSRPAPRRDRYG